MTTRPTTSWRDRLKALKLGAKATGAETVFNDTYLRGNGVVFYLRALVTSKTGANLPGTTEGWAKAVTKVPDEIANELSAPALVKAKEAAERGELWYIKVGTDAEGVGWRWDDAKKGAAKVAAVHAVLSWLLRFREKHVVDGAKAFYVELNNNFLGL
jgi:hypothetical protein